MRIMKTQEPSTLSIDVGGTGLKASILSDRGMDRVWVDTPYSCTPRVMVSALKVWFVDLPTKDCPDNSAIEFTFFWKEDLRWESRNYSGGVAAKVRGPQ
jgi:hypothetical protein